MLATRFWMVCTGLLLGAATFLLFLATSMYNRAGFRAVGAGLSSDSQVVSWYLRVDARQRSARLIQFALNSEIAALLSKASEAEAKVPDGTREKLRQLLLKVHAQVPKEAAFDAVFAVDQHGRVVAHLGYDQAAGMEDFELGGYPVVADALRGYLRDDTLVLDRIYRVVSRPVEYDLTQPPAGAIIGARIVDDRFARELSLRTGAAVAFYARGQRLASAAPDDFDEAQLDQIVGDLVTLGRDTEYREKGRSKVREIGGTLSVQYSKLPGEAWELGAGFAVARFPVAVRTPLDFFERADDTDKERGRIDWAIALAFGLILIGIAFSVLEHTRPIRRFRAEVQRLSKGQVDQLQASRLQGVFRKIATEVNDAVDKAVVSAGGPRRGPADFQRVLGDLPAEPQMSAFSLPDDSDSVTKIAPVPSAAHPMASRPLPPTPRGRLPQAPPAPASATRSPGTDAIEKGGAEQAEWRLIYRDFMELKRRCGENLTGFSYERFERTLRKNRDALMDRHGARKVKFTVYAKDGKAALKATPAKE